jgi:hypothetical protein
LSLVAVPALNWYYNYWLANLEKNKARNNYWRTIITLTSALGAIPGYFLGPTLFVAAGAAAPAMGAIAGGALLSVILGPTVGMFGWKITKALQDNKNWNVPANTNNSWDYATRTTSFLFGNLGVAIGLLVGGPAATILGNSPEVILGGAIGGTIGWALGLATIYIARQIQEEKIDENDPSLPWTQRIGLGNNIGTTIGLISGLGIGFVCGGPGGAAYGAMLGQASMGFVMGIAGALHNSETLRLLAKGWGMLFSSASPVLSETKTPALSSPAIVSRGLADAAAASSEMPGRQPSPPPATPSGSDLSSPTDTDSDTELKHDANTLVGAADLLSTLGVLAQSDSSKPVELTKPAVYASPSLGAQAVEG